MTINRTIEILNPEHRENYDGLDEVQWTREQVRSRQRGVNGRK